MTAEPTTPEASTGDARVDALSVVVPVFNEETWVRRSVEAVVRAGEAAGLRLDVVVVDDGSTDRTPEVLAELADRHGIRPITQANAGRLAARATGLAAATEPWVLMLDSRVIIAPDALTWLRAQLGEHPERRVWCGHVDVETRGDPFAAFWSGLVKIGWRRYTADPRLVSFGLEEFDSYPKGTTCLVTPRDLVLEATEGFESMFDDPRLASDDTRLLRYMAGRTPIWISPEFRFRYHGKVGARGFLRQSYFRGTTFVDSYLGHAGHVRRALLAALAGGVGVLVVGVRRPLLGGVGVLAVLAAAPTVVRLSGGTRDEVRAAATLTPLFVPVFGTGVLRGLALAARNAARLRRTPPA